jgi:hypothetical protein
VVRQEVVRDEERRQVVVSVGVVGEPTELVRRVDVGRAVLRVLNPLGRLQVDREKATGFELALDQGVLVTGRLTVVVGVVLEVEDNRLGDSGSGQDVSSLRLVGCAVGSVKVLEDLGRAGQALGNVGVQRQVGALVDLVGEFFTVDEARSALAGSASGVFAPKGWVSKLKTM